MALFSGKLDGDPVCGSIGPRPDGGPGFVGEIDLGPDTPIDLAGGVCRLDVSGGPSMRVRIVRLHTPGTWDGSSYEFDSLVGPESTP